MIPHPLLVLAVAAVLPGVGQVVNRTPVRGLVFVFYIVLLGAVTYHLTTPGHSFLGRYAGGLFVYAISVVDAYKWAAYRRHTRTPRETAGT
ncbi:MAG: hypothetical protein ACRDPT_13670 [Streptomycetales bacterium]